MGFQTSSSSRSRSVLSEINVTPLVDVMLVLLIMFMVTAPLMQQGIPVDLPKTASSGLQASEEPFVVVITPENKILLAKSPVEMEELRARLKSIFSRRKSQQIYLQADRKVAYGFVAEVIAEIRAAGLTQLGLVTIPKEL